MIQVRRAQERGHAQHGWLDTWHSFSFADYYDPAHMGFSVLRVLNDDRIAPAMGFDPHPHRDMEILTWVLSGAVAHRDSMGNGSVIRPGEVQRMSAGTGVVHSEFNASADQELHLLQIWLLPSQRGLTPGYEQVAFPDEELRHRWRLVASPDGRDGSVTLHQDALLRIARLQPGEELPVALPSGRSAWLHVANGAVRLGEAALGAGDAVGLSGEPPLTLRAEQASEVLLFELPPIRP